MIILDSNMIEEVTHELKTDCVINSILNKLTRNKRKIKYNFSINPDKEIIIDFYNVYCNFINFERFKTFTKNTFVSCLNKILSMSSNSFLVVSKPIFEVSDEVILKQTLKYSNLTYIIVIDGNETKSLNKERDDFVCLFLHFLRKDGSYIVSNDRFINCYQIIDTVKPVVLKIFYGGNISYLHLDKKNIEDIKVKMNEGKLNIIRRSFKFTSGNL